ncbi:DOMON-like domain-containing protein [Novosphingobium aquimarinum]|uniref:DOMON-like domain-containing protein n=1 Tax=Novosphingobium aquimarinum TaxID=2682494 RepID=UPI001E5AAE0A|nr:DOMON-like domain-containing protein [Novosphingobium aquimarinum]
MQTASLVSHPAYPPRSVRSITTRITPDGEWVRLRWRIEGANDLVVPAFAGKGRADNLWRTTCFELFLRAPGERAYVELNLSPSERWAAYEFTGYREGMAERPAPREPACTMRAGEALAIFDAAVPSAALPPLPWECAMAAVIEETGGIKSYWALGHGKPEPDFHDPACFVLSVPAPGGA